MKQQSTAKVLFLDPGTFKPGMDALEHVMDEEFQAVLYHSLGVIVLHDEDAGENFGYKAVQGRTDLYRSLDDDSMYAVITQE
jgi:hypothetical protein